MRIKALAALAAGIIGIGLGAATASAGDWHRSEAPRGWGYSRTIHHHVYYPRYHHVYHTHAATDPYAYRYSPRGYYPYYNSGYWAPAHVMRAKKRCKPRVSLPPYYTAWGYPKRNYNHRAWHAKHHGRIRIGHW